jgi:YebC/PmpR family DNA-binding regulatory protein
LHNYEITKKYLFVNVVCGKLSTMSGHSKWHNIKRQKEANDSKKGKVFSKMSRLITVAAKQGGGDPDANPALRLAIQKAKDARMPKDNIDRAIKKGTGELAGESIEEVTYEAFGPNGGAFMIMCYTDNLNRTVSELRNIFSKAGGNLGTKGSAAYIFSGPEKEASFFVEVAGESEAQKIDSLIETLEDHDDVQEILHNYKFIES